MYLWGGGRYGWGGSWIWGGAAVVGEGVEKPTKSLLVVIKFEINILKHASIAQRNIAILQNIPQLHRKNIAQAALTIFYEQ